MIREFDDSAKKFANRDTTARVKTQVLSELKRYGITEEEWDGAWEELVKDKVVQEALKKMMAQNQVVLFDFQLDALKMALGYLKFIPSKNLLLNFPPGSGKSLIINCLAYILAK